MCCRCHCMRQPKPFASMFYLQSICGRFVLSHWVIFFDFLWFSHCSFVWLAQYMMRFVTRWTDYFIVWHCKINNFLRDWMKITNVDKGLSKRQPHTKKIDTTTTEKKPKKRRNDVRIEKIEQRKSDKRQSMFSRDRKVFGIFWLLFIVTISSTRLKWILLCMHNSNEMTNALPRLYFWTVKAETDLKYHRIENDA